MEIKKFNIRVYGILVNEDLEVLVSDELINGHEITKFPGGGLEFGEGIIDCLKREFIEETNNRIEVKEHFYTTEHFQQSKYNKEDQIISIYYFVKPISDFNITIAENIFDFKRKAQHEQTFRWIDSKSINKDDFTLPIDKIVGEKLQELFLAVT